MATWWRCAPARQQQLLRVVIGVKRTPSALLHSAAVQWAKSNIFWPPKNFGLAAPLLSSWILEQELGCSKLIERYFVVTLTFAFDTVDKHHVKLCYTAPTSKIDCCEMTCLNKVCAHVLWMSHDRMKAERKEINRVCTWELRRWLLYSMGAIRWGPQGRVPPLFQTVGYNMPYTPMFALWVLCLERFQKWKGCLSRFL